MLSRVLEYTGFCELIDSTVEWDVAQFDVTPGDAAKTMSLPCLWVRARGENVFSFLVCLFLFLSVHL